MKFSVLLPTRNRLQYLRYAVETVRRQDYQNWEIIVSDNFSEDDIAGYVDSLGDTRIKYLRTDTLLPVTDNWNNALRYSDGDYIVMLGDDDGLLPGYFSTLLKEFEKFPEPDFVYVSAYFFAYPGVLPNEPDGFLRRDRNRIFTADRSFWLDTRRARAIARGYLQFRMPVASNMQFSLISRRKVAELTRNGQFFKSPFPDFYATPALFLRSDRILVCPYPMVVIGITPKSYGSFHFNNRPADGVKFLENSQSLGGANNHQSLLLPGTSYNDSWLLAMEELYESIGKLHGMRPNYRRYRFLQIVHGYKHCYFDGVISPGELEPLRARMRFWERLVYGVFLPLGFGLIRLIPGTLRDTTIAALRRLIGQHAINGESPTSAKFMNLIEVYESMDSLHVSA